MGKKLVIKKKEDTNICYIEFYVDRADGKCLLANMYLIMGSINNKHPQN
jgi:hypothetical protein